MDTMLRKKRYKTSKDLSRLVEGIISTEERIKLMAELARGVMVEKHDKRSGEKRIYLEPPNERAIMWLNEIQHGKSIGKDKQSEQTKEGESSTNIAFLPVSGFNLESMGIKTVDMTQTKEE